MKINLNFKKFCVPVLLFSLFYPCFSQKDTAGLYNPNGMRSSDESFAAEEFRRGIQSFYRGSYNDSVFWYLNRDILQVVLFQPCNSDRFHSLHHFLIKIC